MQWLQKKFKTVQHRSVFFSVGRYRLCVHCHQGRRVLSCQHWRPGKWLRQFVLKPSYKVSQNSELAFLYWCDVIYECSFTTVSFFPFIIQYFLLELFFSWGGGVYSLLSRHVWICCLKKLLKVSRVDELIFRFAWRHTDRLLKAGGKLSLCFLELLFNLQSCSSIKTCSGIGLCTIFPVQ